MKFFFNIAVIIISIALCSCGKYIYENNLDLSVQKEFSETDNAINNVTCEVLVKEVSKVIGENYFPDMQIEDDYFEQQTGLTNSLYDEFAGEMAKINTNVDTIIIVKAKEGKIAEVEQKLSEYRNQLLNDTMQYPTNTGKIQASRIEQIDSYVCFVQLGGDTTIVNGQDDESIIAYCQHENELAISTIEVKVANGI